MKKYIMIILAVLVMVPFLLGNTSSCSEADVASRNLAKAAEQFEVVRRVTFVNGITDQWLVSIEGKCSVEIIDFGYETTCKTPSGEYLKHMIGKADNAFPVIEQLEASKVSTSHYRVIMRPSLVIPNIDIE